MFRTLRTVEPRTATEQSAYDTWLDQRPAREPARNDRIHGAVGVIPTPLWVVLFFTSALIFVFMLFFADSGERAVVQGLLMGTVVAVITAMLLLLGFLDHPFHDGVGGLRPVAMERTLQIIDEELKISGAEPLPPAMPAGTRGRRLGTALRRCQYPVPDLGLLTLDLVGSALLVEGRACVRDVAGQPFDLFAAHGLLDQRPHDLHLLGVGGKRVRRHHPAPLRRELPRDVRLVVPRVVARQPERHQR